MSASSSDMRAELRARIALIEGGCGSQPQCKVVMDEPAAQEPCSAPANDADEENRAFRKIERLSLVREQASEQIRQRLIREGFESDVVESALVRALACGLVDDARFAEVLVRSRLSQGRGRRGIASELERLGIDPDGVEGLFDVGDDDESEVARALSLLDRKPPQSKNLRDGAYRRLAQKGFSASVSVTAARLWCESRFE